MASFGKVVLAAVGVAVLAGGFVVQDWYRFAKYSEIDANRGIFGNDHLEVWIDINAAMPAPMRKWACKTLLDRETAVLGGAGAVPYGCAADFDPNAAAAVMSTAITDGVLSNITLRAQGSGATADQLTAIKTCMAAEFIAKIPPEQIEAVNGASPDPAAMSALSVAGQEAGAACLTAAGL